MYKNLNILVLFIFLISAGVQAQVDSVKSQLPNNAVAKPIEQVAVPIATVHVSDSFKLKAFKPDPGKVVWMAAIIPGYGHILNKKYWKLPLVYGGFLGCAYAIAWNSGQYNSFRNAFLDINKYNNSDINYKNAVDKNPSIVSFYQMLPKGYTVETYHGYVEYEKKLKTGQDFYRRYRDLSIIATIGYYALTIVDAYVDAQLYDFDISPDLSLRFQPALIKNGLGNNTFAMQCNIHF